MIDSMGMNQATIKAENPIDATNKYLEGFNANTAMYLRDNIIAIDIDDLSTFKKAIKLLKH